MTRTALISLSIGLFTQFADVANAQRRGNLAQSRDAVANGWLFDYAAAKKQARRDNKPLMVVFRCVP